MFDPKKPTAQMLGRWQPWHTGHTELFKCAIAETGQVVIMIRDVAGIIGDDAGAGRTNKQDDNPFDIETVKHNVKTSLEKEGYIEGEQYILLEVPNIVDISYGRGVGYTFTEHNLGEEIHNISGTNIRKHLRKTFRL